MNTFERQVIQWKVADLRESPYQQQLFGDLPEGPLDELAADMEKHGQRDPVEILRDGTIIDGHQRRRAAVKLGWDEVAVVVRDDLAEAGDEAVQSYMLSVNLARRQMDIMAIARAYRRMKQLERGWDRDEFDVSGAQDIRDKLAKRLGSRSGRTLDRYLRLLETPREIQDAYTRHDLPMSTALKVVRLSDEVKADIVAAIRHGQPAKAAIDAYFAARRSRPANVEANEFIESLASAADPPAEAVTQPVDSGEDLRALNGQVEILESTINSVIEADLPPRRKIDAFIQAAAQFELLLDEAETEAAE